MTEPLEYWKRLAESRTENGEEIARENATLKARVEELERERTLWRNTANRLDRGLSEARSEIHERPTAWAYEQACAALEKHRARADAAEAREAGLLKLLPLLDGSHLHADDCDLQHPTSADACPGCGCNLALERRYRAALASTAEPIHAVPTKEQTRDESQDEGVRARGGPKQGAPGLADIPGGAAGGGERRGVPHPENHKEGPRSPSEEVAAAPPAQQPNDEPFRVSGEAADRFLAAMELPRTELQKRIEQEAKEVYRKTKAKLVAPAQQPETPHGHAVTRGEGPQKWTVYCCDRPSADLLHGLMDRVEAERDALREKLQETERWAKERDTAARRSDPARKSYEGRLAAERARAEKLQRFKDYVHQRLDAMGVPADPEPTKNAEHGCRIEGRLNYLAKEKAALRERLSRAREWTEDDVERVISDAQAAITTTLDNEARAVSKGSAPYADAFRRAALANNVADAIAAALLEIPPEGGEK